MANLQVAAESYTASLYTLIVMAISVTAWFLIWYIVSLGPNLEVVMWNLFEENFLSPTFWAVVILCVGFHFVAVMSLKWAGILFFPKHHHIIAEIEAGYAKLVPPNDIEQGSRVVENPLSPRGKRKSFDSEIEMKNFHHTNAHGKIEFRKSLKNIMVFTLDDDEKGKAH
jgi:hypothetical protein